MGCAGIGLARFARFAVQEIPHRCTSVLVHALGTTVEIRLSIACFNIDDVFTMFRHARISETVSPLCFPRQVPFARVEPPIDTLPPVVTL